ncbi:cytochrome P450, partial [Hymenopellis radicata]
LMDGGSDTSSSVLLTLILALASNPECQQRAFEEVQSVVGARMPEICDMEKMPFVTALIKEILRLRPPVSIGLPHAASKTYTYNGYLIPKGATVIINIYGIMNDPKVFENPHTFNPERFMQSEFGTRPGKDQNFRDNFAFGGGRVCILAMVSLRVVLMLLQRICPGQWLANHTW